MLENLIRFMADNTGSLFSANSISKFLKSQGQNISTSIISNYISYILDSYYLIKVSRSDLQGERIFETNEKYYFEDVGLRNAWMNLLEETQRGVEHLHLREFLSMRL